jgi:hypothetical protein
VKAIDICLKAIAHYGEQNQIMIFLGELAELSQAVEKGDRSGIIEELADVQICLAQRFLIAGIDPDLSKVPTVTGGLNDFFAEIVLQEARLVQGRNWRPLALYCLSGWIDKVVHDFKAKDEVEEIKVFKLKRLMRRIKDEKMA